MSHSVAAKITRAPKIEHGKGQDGQSTMFLFEISEYTKDRDQQAQYTNYSVCLFAKTQGAVEYHMKAIQEGSFVVIDCDKLQLDLSNTEYPKLRMIMPRLGGFMNSNEQAPAQQPQQQYAPQQQPAPQMAPPQQAPAYQPQQQHPQQQQYAPQPQGYGGAQQQMGK